MPELNVEKIINGTDSKVLFHAYESMKENYSDESARNYRHYYTEKPLSFIIKNARYILSEPRYGVPYFEWVVINCPISYMDMQTINECAKDYYDEHSKKMSSTMDTLYNNFINLTDSYLAERKCEAIVEPEDTDSDFYDNAFCAVCKYVESPEGFDDCDLCSDYDDFQSYLESYKDKKAVILLTPYAEKLHVEPQVYNAYRQFVKESTTDTMDFARNLINCNEIQALFGSDRFMESVNNMSNINIKGYVNGILNTDIADSIIEAYNESVKNDAGIIYSSSYTAVNAIMEESVYDDLYKEDRKELSKDFIRLKHAVYESARNLATRAFEVTESEDAAILSPFMQVIVESMYTAEEISSEGSLKVMTEAVSEIEAMLDDKSFFEYADDGSAPDALKKRYPSSADDKPHKHNSSVNNDDDEDTEIEDSNKVTSKDLPDDGPGKKPRKPKEGILSKTRNKVMDINVAAKKKAGKLRQLGKEVGGVGKAILKIPKGIIQKIKNIGENFDKWDDNRRKEYMSKPGFRKRVFRNLRVAITYLLAGSVNILLVPITWFARRLSKEKDKRIRNEFVADINTEIKVCEIKIDQAQANDDQEKRIKLTRIKERLVRERDRVATNSKYI